MLGDGRTVALVAADGQIDWWPVPALERAAHMRRGPGCPRQAAISGLAPEDEPSDVNRRYVPGTNVLETT